MRRRPLLLPGVVAALILIAGSVAADLTYPWTYLVSQPAPSTPDLVGNKTSEYASATYDGRKVVFTSDANNLWDEFGHPDSDPLDSWDVFLRDLEAGDTSLISMDNNRLPGTGESAFGTISRDGGWVVFQSTSKTMMNGTEGDDTIDVFLVSAGDPIHFRYKVSRSKDTPSSYRQPNNASGNTTMTTREELGSVFANPYSPAAIYLLADGTPRVVYQSKASNLDLAYNDLNGKQDFYVWNKASESNRLLTRTASGGGINGDAWQPVTSFNGRYVAFVSDATNLVSGVSYPFCQMTKKVNNVDVVVNGVCSQVYLMDRDPDEDGVLDDTSPAYTLVSRTPAGLPASGPESFGIASPDGKDYLLSSWYPSISADGALVAYSSLANNLQTQVNDTNQKLDIYVFNRRTGTNELVSMQTYSGNPVLLTNNSFTPSISADGRMVTFTSYPNNVTQGDTNQYCYFNPELGHIVCDDVQDIFRFDRLETDMTKKIIKISVNNQDPLTIGNQTYRESSFPFISGNRRAVFFTSYDSLLPDGDFINPEEIRNIYERDFGDPGTAPLLYETPARWTTAPVMAGGSRTTTVKLSNIGDAVLTIDGQVPQVKGIFLDGPDAAQFGLENENNCVSNTLSPAVNGYGGGFCQFTLDFHPDASRTMHAELVITSDDPTAPVIRISLQGGPAYVNLPVLAK